MAEPSPEMERDHAGVTVPPPLIYVGALALALLIDYLSGGPNLGALLGMSSTLRYVVGIALFILGLALPLIASARFRSAGTNVRPWMPSTTLVTSGVYRFTRNPMYLGLTLAYAGLSLLADSVIALLSLLPVLAIIHYGVIKREERYLEVKFGEPYREYKRKVRRWL